MLQLRFKFDHYAWASPHCRAVANKFNSLDIQEIDSLVSQNGRYGIYAQHDADDSLIISMNYCFNLREHQVININSILHEFKLNRRLFVDCLSHTMAEIADPVDKETVYREAHDELEDLFEHDTRDYENGGLGLTLVSDAELLEEK